MQANGKTGLMPGQKTESRAIAAPGAEEGWPPWLMVAFRFMFAYTVLYILPFPLTWIRWTSVVSKLYEKMWEKIVPFVGAHILHLSSPITYFPSGSGDKISNWVQLLCALALAIVVTAIWSVLDRRRKNYSLLQSWWCVYMATYLGSVMLSYGLDKIIPAQMPYPTLNHMMEPFGYQSPMGLLWNFMGAAPGYEIAAGTVEILAGFLFFVPRMKALAALITVGAIGNVFLLDFFYDVPLRLYTAHLVAFAVLLLLPDLKRLTNFFVLNRATQPEHSVLPFRSRAWNGALWGVRWALAIFVVYAGLVQSWSYYSMVKDLPKTNPMYGIWHVDQFMLAGTEHPPLTTDNERWEYIIFDYKAYATIQDMQGVPLRNSEGAPIRFASVMNTKGKTLTLKNPANSTWKFEATYDRGQPDRMTMDGQWNGKTLHLALRKMHPSFFLSTRGLHWVNDRAINR